MCFGISLEKTESYESKRKCKSESTTFAFETCHNDHNADRLLFDRSGSCSGVMFVLFSSIVREDLSAGSVSIVKCKT